ncbi:allantoate permease family MFS transporter [Lachancea thermotolerans CBS 6340]|uniref:KLTH0G19668p n=1 Tax=Lachancea thermotolerans (strain ATCC 56472 / CBS 6340 / NRRL Y-8284) TaxID=559295 RepID=C5DNT4_LACTC|nr:KLTH0G19668p [Lachancea thermotolerans CBS 6340]CAR25445.1 KLTH0G19668p [Lachancea thermotolerans CBS 6340]
MNGHSSPAKELEVTTINECCLAKSSTQLSVVEGEVCDQSISGDTPTTHGTLQIDPAEEKALVRKLDRRFVPVLAFAYFLQSLDKTNIGNAYTSGMKEDLDLTPKQYSNAVSVLYSTFLIAQVPTTLYLRVIPPRYFMSGMVFCWSIITLCSGFVKSYHSLIALRVLLGAFEGGYFPAMVLLVSMIYKPEEQAKRIAFFFSCAALAGAFGGLIATGLATVHGAGGLNGWRWLYIIEGLVSTTAAVWIYFGLPTDVEMPAFMNNREKSLLKVRSKQRLQYIGPQPNFSWDFVWDALKDFKVYSGLAIQFCQNIILYAFTTFLPAILKLGMGYSSRQAQYLTVPVYILAAAVFLSSAYFSDRFNMRGPIILCFNIVTIIGYIIMLTAKTSGVKYFACYLMTFSAFTGPGLNVTWVSNNIAPHYKRATAIGLSQMFGNLAGAIAGQVYIKPPYVLGNSFSLGCVGFSSLLVALQIILFYRINERRAAILRGAVVDKFKKRSGDKDLNFKYCI